MVDNAKLAELVEKSTSTDLQVQLSLKEAAKRQAMDDPTPTNLATLERATKMVESTMAAAKCIKGWKEALEYIAHERGKKCGKTKLFADIKAALCIKQPDGSFKQRDLDRYAASLPALGTPDGLAEKAADRRKRKEEADISRAETAAEREKFEFDVKRGLFVPREQVHLELAARAVTLSTGLKTALEARNLDLVAIVDGNPKKGAALVELLESILDEGFNEYSREMEFDVKFLPEGEGDGADS